MECVHWRDDCWDFSIMRLCSCFFVWDLDVDRKRIWEGWHFFFR